LSAKDIAESREVSPGVVIDYAANGDIVGIDIDNASTKLDLKELVLNRELPSAAGQAPMLFDLRPVHNQFSLVPRTVCQVRIDQVLIGNTRSLRHLFKIFNRLDTQAYGHLLFQPLDMRVIFAGHS
jgi:hypothetical protein